MKIVPKIADCDYLYMESKQFYVGYDTIELQMLGDTILESFERCKILFEECVDVKTFILHIPLSCVNFLDIISNEKLHSEFISMVVESIRLCEFFDISINILVHNKCSIDSFKLQHGDFELNVLLKMMEGTRVSLLMENSIFDTQEEIINFEIFDYIFSKFDSKHLNFNLDICHLHASEYKNNQSIRIPDSVRKRITNIHFSKTKDNDGYSKEHIDKTHAQLHENVDDCLLDLQYIESKGVSLENINLVTEIIEDDYINRPRMKTEIEYLKKLVA